MEGGRYADQIRRPAISSRRLKPRLDSKTPPSWGSKRRKTTPSIWFCLFLQPHEGGVSRSCRGFNRPANGYLPTSVVCPPSPSGLSKNLSERTNIIQPVLFSFTVQYRLFIAHSSSFPREAGVTLARGTLSGPWRIGCRTTRQYTQTNRNRRCSCFSRHCCWRTCRCKHPQTHRRWGC